MYIIVPNLTGKEGEERKRNQTEIEINDQRRKTRQNQTTISHICRNQTENILQHLWGNQAENQQEHLQVDKHREKKRKKTQATTTPVASTLDIDGLKPQDDTATVR